MNTNWIKLETKCVRDFDGFVDTLTLFGRIVNNEEEFTVVFNLDEIEYETDAEGEFGIMDSFDEAATQYECYTNLDDDSDTDSLFLSHSDAFRMLVEAALEDM